MTTDYKKKEEETHLSFDANYKKVILTVENSNLKTFYYKLNYKQFL